MQEVKPKVALPVSSDINIDIVNFRDQIPHVGYTVLFGIKLKVNYV
jgi:hypothetical protein